jgi:hypothetical protein
VAAALPHRGGGRGDRGSERLLDGRPLPARCASPLPAFHGAPAPLLAAIPRCGALSVKLQARRPHLRHTQSRGRPPRGPTPQREQRATCRARRRSAAPPPARATAQPAAMATRQRVAACFAALLGMHAAAAGAPRGRATISGPRPLPQAARTAGGVRERADGLGRRQLGRAGTALGRRARRGRRTRWRRCAAAPLRRCAAHPRPLRAAARRAGVYTAPHALSSSPAALLLPSRRPTPPPPPDPDPPRPHPPLPPHAPSPRPPQRRRARSRAACAPARRSPRTSAATC